MTVQYIMSAFGVMLIAVAVFGSKLTVKGFSFFGIRVAVSDLAVPLLSKSTRVVLALVGAALLVGTAAGWQRIGGWICRGPCHTPRQELTITNRLASRQEYKRIRIFMGGRQVASLAADRDRRAQSVRVTVSEGDEYALTGSEASRGEDGVLRVRMVRGRGSFHLTDRSDYSILQRGSKTDETTTYELKPTRR